MKEAWDKARGFDPVAIGYRDLWTKIKCGVLIAVVIGYLAWRFGLPHVQWTYTTPYPESGWVSAQMKTQAWYYGPGGWKQTRANAYEAPGCPFLLFVPAENCIGRPHLNDRFPFLSFKQNQP